MMLAVVATVVILLWLGLDLSSDVDVVMGDLSQVQSHFLQAWAVDRID
jgi:type VI protein secretion system component VasF